MVCSARVAALSVLMLTAACDRLTATATAVSMVTRTPGVTEAEYADQTLLGLLAKSPVPAANLAMVGIFDRGSVTSTELLPLTDATVDLGYTGADLQPYTVRLCEAGGGAYEADSLDPGACSTSPDPFDYVVGSDYTTRIEAPDGETYTLAVKAPASLDPGYVTFVPPLGTGGVSGGQTFSWSTHTAGDPLTVDWSGAFTPGQQKRVLLTLAHMDYSGSFSAAAEIADPDNWSPDSAVYTDFPDDASGVLELLAGVPDTSVDIEGSALSDAGLYLLVLTAVEMNTDTSENLTYGSGAIAGAGTGFLFMVQ